MFVVALTENGTGKIVYAYYDADCGYLMGLDLSGAHMFPTFEEAEKIYNRMLSERERKFDEGVYPPDFIHRGFRLNYEKLHASGTLSIMEVRTHVIERTIVAVEGTIPQQK